MIAVYIDKNDISDDVPTDDTHYAFETEFESRSPSNAIVEAIAAIEGARTTDVDFSLFESVNPDALDLLFGESSDDEESADDVVVEFRVDGYLVQVRSDGTITVKAIDSSE